MKYWLTIVFFLFIIHVVNAEENLVGYWKFESINSTNYTLDYSGYGNDGKLINFSTNPPNTVAGRIGNALKFDGVDDYVDFSNPILVGNGESTFSVWIKTSSTDAAVVVGESSTISNNPLAIIQVNNKPNEMKFAIRNDTQPAGTPGFEVSDFTGIHKDGNWHNYVGVRHSTHLSIYRDGVLVNSTDINYIGTVSLNSRSIGALKRNATVPGGLNFFFNGTIDEVKIWNRALTAIEIFENYFGKRTNPIVIPDVSEVSGNLNQNYTFNIIVTNMDNQSYGASVFKLISDCPAEWNCSLNPINQTISPKNSSFYNLTIKPGFVTEEKTIVNVTAINMNDTRYNTTIKVGFILGSKCAKASIRISDVYFYTNTSANVTVENTGNSSLVIKSAVITDKSGKTYNPDKLPTSFDAGKKVYIIYSNISSCENFSKIVVSTDCPLISANYSETRCQVKPAVVKIRSVKYEDDIVKIELRNEGSETINSDSIKFLIDNQNAICNKSFKLVPKGIERCDVVGFICSKTTAKLKITAPNTDEKEFECLKPIIITTKTCIDALCNEPSETFVEGKKIYFNVTTAPKTNITAILSLNSGEEQLIDITQPFKPKEAGDYTIKLTASKEGYKDTASKIEFTVIEGSGFPIKIVFIGLGIVILAGIIVFYINHRKNKQFEKLYQKYGRPNPQTRVAPI